MSDMRLCCCACALDWQCDSGSQMLQGSLLGVQQEGWGYSRCAVDTTAGVLGMQQEGCWGYTRCAGDAAGGVLVLQQAAICKCGGKPVRAALGSMVACNNKACWDGVKEVLPRCASPVSTPERGEPAARGGSAPGGGCGSAWCSPGGPLSATGLTCQQPARTACLGLGLFYKIKQNIQ